MKVIRGEEAAEQLGLTPKMLELLEEEGRIEAQEKIGGVSYYNQVAIERLIHELYFTLQRATWNDMENRMEAVEKRIEEMDKKFKKLRDASSKLL